MAKTTDELFAEATEADYETAEPVTLAASDTEEEFQFRIDEHLRTIAIPEKGVVAGVEGDLNVNIARFTMTRYYHGRDLSKLNIRLTTEMPMDRSTTILSVMPQCPEIALYSRGSSPQM